MIVSAVRVVGFVHGQAQLAVTIDRVSGQLADLSSNAAA